VEGTKQLNFPITETDARKLFYAIDVDSDNGMQRNSCAAVANGCVECVVRSPASATGLSYSEIVSVLEPSSFTSFQNGIISEEDMGKLVGFQTFTGQQAKKLVEIDENLNMAAHEDSGQLTPPGTADRDEEEHQRLEKVRVGECTV